MKVGKPQSKRVPTRLRHKIQKASASKQKKQRKEAKKNPQWRSRLKKDPGIPNLFPFKAQVLAEIEESKRKKEEEKLRVREEAAARRQGKAVADVAAIAAEADVEDEDELIDYEDGGADVDEDMEVDSSNPMAALLASAQARAQNFGEDDDEDDEDEDDDDDDGAEWGGIKDEKAAAPNAQPAKNILPKQVLADPVKTVSALMDRMQQTQDGVQRLIEHYQIPPLVTAGSDLSTRFLVDVARKRGRLGRGGVPNLHAAALIVLNDLNEERLKLPAVPLPQKADANSNGKSQVTIVKAMAEPFKLAGLWGEDEDSAQAMVLQTA